MQAKILKKEIEEKESFEEVFSTEKGKKVLEILARECVSVLGKYESDDRKAAFNEGKISMFMLILKLAKISKDVFFFDTIKQYEQVKELQMRENNFGGIDNFLWSSK